MPAPIENALLAALPRAEYRRVRAMLEPVTLTFGDVLYEQGDPITQVYFPNDSLVSLLTLVDRHLALEVGLVGREGMVGVAYAMGIDATPFRALVQGTGSAMGMKASAFRRELNASASLQREVHRYAHALLAQVAKTAACNRFHVVQERLARWLLMTRDRMRSDHFHLTHEFLANMLGVRRVGVTMAAHALRQRKLITYSRGDITITDRRGLEAAACSCYSKPAA
ncbi:MAG TPA: Crp/Fnr family transcriptional regulator [Usitatibacter sp.]|nr:Crp/Fnr family transcriptional regulator [Usitatibacter sp.]